MNSKECEEGKCPPRGEIIDAHVPHNPHTKLTVTFKTESAQEHFIHTSQMWLRYFRGFGVDTRVLSVLTTNPEKYQTLQGDTE